MVSLPLIFLVAAFCIQHGLTAPAVENEDIQTLDAALGDTVSPLNFETALKFSDETLSRDSIEQGIRVDSITDIQRIPEVVEEKVAPSEESFPPLIIKEDPSPQKEASPELLQQETETVVEEEEAQRTLGTEIEDREFLDSVKTVEQDLDAVSTLLPEDASEELQEDLSPVSSPPEYPVNDTRVRKTVKKDLSADLETNKFSISIEPEADDNHPEEDATAGGDPTTTIMPPTDVVARAEKIVQRIKEFQDVLSDLSQIRQNLVAVKSKFNTLREAIRADQDSNSVLMASEKFLETSNFGGFYDPQTLEEENVLKDLVQPGTLQIEEVVSPILTGKDIPNIQEPKTVPLSLQMSISPVKDSTGGAAYNFSQELDGPANKPFYIFLGPFTAVNGSISASKSEDGSQPSASLDVDVVYIDPNEGIKPIPIMAVHNAWSPSQFGDLQ